MTCRMCGSTNLGPWLDLGAQTLTNRFLLDRTTSEYTHPCKLGVCMTCATVQLESPVPLDEMRPRFDWIAYNEPEKHLDDVADVLTRLPGISTDSIFAGISYKDDSTLARLNQRGFTRTWRADLLQDLGCSAPNSGIESIQAAMTPATASRLATRYPKPDVLLFRHVLEHSYDLQGVLAALRLMVRPGGCIVLEMPDARRALERLDYSTIWEEHLFYFTPTTLRRCLAHAGYDVLFLESYHYTLENSLLAIIRPTEKAYPLPMSQDASREELNRAERFIAEFPKVRQQYRDRIAGFARSRGRVAMLGAGHLSAAYLNFYGLADVVDFVADDNPKKQGLFMPGSRRPILAASELLTRDIKLCLMSVRPEIEDAVLAKNQAFIDRGGILASVFPDSRYSFDMLGSAACVR